MNVSHSSWNLFVAVGWQAFHCSSGSGPATLHTSPQHHDYEPLKRAVQLIADVNDDVESTMKIAENRNEVTNIEALFGNTVQLSSPSRRYILNTKVTFDDGRREHKCLMFLFNNLLLIGKTKGRHKFSAIAKHGFTPHTKADILRGNDIVIKDKGDDGVSIGTFNILVDYVYGNAHHHVCSH